MDYIRLGKAGVKVSKICLGTMTFGREADEPTSFQIMDRYVEMGGNFLDTANVYSVGGSEEVVGRWLKERNNRREIFLATKVFGTMGQGPNDAGLSRFHIFRAVEDSLRRLQTDVIDLYQLHHWDSGVPVEETLEAMDDLVRQGKVRYIGCSNFTAWQISKGLQASREHHWSRFISLQPIFNAVNRSIENEMLPFCEVEGIGVIAYNPLAGGVLTGKYRKGEQPAEGTRLRAIKMYMDRYFTDEALDLVERFLAEAGRRGVSPAQLALAWVLSESRVTCPIIGARNLEQLNDTMGGLEIRLSSEEREQIPAVLPGRWVGKDPVYDHGQ